MLPFGSKTYAEIAMQSGMESINLEPQVGQSTGQVRHTGGTSFGGGRGRRQSRNSLAAQAQSIGRFLPDNQPENVGSARNANIGSKRPYTERPMRNLELNAPGSMVEPYRSGTVSTGSKPRDRKNLTQYGPMKTFEIENQNFTRLHTAPNGLTDETIIATTGPHAIVLYRLKITDVANEKGTSSKPQMELIKVHEVDFVGTELGCFTLSSMCSLTLPPQYLIYAFCPFASSTVYLADFRDEYFVPDKITFGAVDLAGKHGESVRRIVNDHCSLQLALKDDHYLACLLENREVVVWDIFEGKKLCRFRLNSPGIHISWHPSENFKLMVVESNGYVKFFNVMKERCYTTQYMCQSPLYSGDWAYSDSLFSAVGWAGGVTTFNSSQVTTNMFKINEQPCKVFTRVVFNPSDNKALATLELGFTYQRTIHLWRSHFPHFMWAFSNAQLVDIGWTYAGKSFIVALGTKKIFIFDGSMDV